MKNKEKYIDEFIEASCHYGMCGFVNKYVQSVKELEDEEKGCWNGCWDDCKYCMEELKKWLEEEYNPKPRLNQEEYVILTNVDDVYDWIVRDRDGDLYLYALEPSKEKYCWKCNGLNTEKYFPFTSNFQFIKWEDEEPYNIYDLIDEYKKYYNKD